MTNANEGKSPIIRRLESIKGTDHAMSLRAERDRQLRQSVDIVNQLINENLHRPDSVRLLRKILRERSEMTLINEQDKNSLSG